MLVNGKEFKKGDIYYSVGPLQIGLIEEWQVTGDRFDLNRGKMGNMFKTQEEAQRFLDYLKNYEG